MLSVIVVPVDAGSYPRGRNPDNKGVTLGPTFSTGFRYNEPENLEVASLESCQPGTGPNIRSALREDIVGMGGE